MEKLLKEKNSVVKTAETFVAGALATKLLEVGCIPLVVGVVAFVATTVWIVKSIKAGKGNLTRKAKILMVALAAISTMALIYGIYHKMYCHNSAVEAQNDVVTETTPDTEEKPEEEEKEEPTEDVDSKVEASNAGKVVTSRGYCPSEDRIEVTYGNVGGNNSGAANTTSTGVALVDPAKETLHVKAEDKSAQDEEIANDVENGKERVELSDGIVATKEKTTDKTTEEKSASEEEKTTMDKTDAVEVKSEEDKKENNTEEKKSDETKVEESKPAEATDYELDAMLKSSETIETTPEIGLVEIDAEVFPKDEIIEEVKPEEKAVTVEAIDGYIGTINSTMQFRIDGDNVSIEGLEGMNYSFNNGILNLETGSEATVLTVEVSNEVSTVSFDIVINGVVK